MKEIEIKKWVIRISKVNQKERGILIGLDRDGNEYIFNHHILGELATTDIICTEV